MPCAPPGLPPVNNLRVGRKLVGIVRPILEPVREEWILHCPLPIRGVDRDGFPCRCRRDGRVERPVPVRDAQGRRSSKVFWAHGAGKLGSYALDMIVENLLEFLSVLGGRGRVKHGTNLEGSDIGGVPWREERFLYFVDIGWLDGGLLHQG